MEKHFPLESLYGFELLQDLLQSISQEIEMTPDPFTVLRPLQTTIPMGYKWAVFITYRKAQNIIKQAFKLFLRHQHCPRLLPVLLWLSQSKNSICHNPGDVVGLEIIDDVNLTFND